MIKRIMNKASKEIRYRSYRKRLINPDVTIICQNCVAGVMYHQLGIDFKSPTINGFFEDENFVKLAYDFPKYMEYEAEPLVDQFVDPIDNTMVYPKIKIYDIEFCALHYKNCEEAVNAWNRRRKRVNLNNLCVIGNTWNLHNNPELIDKLAHCPEKTIIFSTEELPYDNCIKLPGDIWTIDERSIVRPNITDDIPGTSFKYFETFFDYVDWLNK